MLPAQGSAFAAEVDTVYMALFWLSVFLSFVPIAVRIFQLAEGRRCRNNVKQQPGKEKE